MRVSLKWLAEMVGISLGAKELARSLTMGYRISFHARSGWPRS